MGRCPQYLHITTESPSRGSLLTRALRDLRDLVLGTGTTSMVSKGVPEFILLGWGAMECSDLRFGILYVLIASVFGNCE